MMHFNVPVFPVIQIRGSDDQAPRGVHQLAVKAFVLLERYGRRAQTRPSR